MNQWVCKHFNQLSTTDLFLFLQLRSKVFVVEQQCVFLDIEDSDKVSYHVFNQQHNNEKIFAYSKIIPPGVKYPKAASIGRVVVGLQHREKKIGSELMQFSIEKCKQLFPQKKINIGAQCVKQEFYEALGFKAQGETYLEDGIKHINMFLT